MSCLSFITEGALFYSMFTFFPKYLQDQFRIDVFTAGTITGITRLFFYMVYYVLWTVLHNLISRIYRQAMLDPGVSWPISLMAEWL